MAQNADLIVVSAEKKGSRQWIRVRAENGVEKNFSIGLKKGDLRGDLNEQSCMKRFSRENSLRPPEEEAPVEKKPDVKVTVKRAPRLAPAPTAPVKEPRTREIVPAPMLRTRQANPLPVLAQALIAAEAEAGVLVETVPEKPQLAPAPISPVPETTPVKSVMSQKQAPVSMLSPVDFYKVCTWLKTQVLENCPSLEALTLQAGQHIGTGVSEEEMKLVMQTTEITEPAHWSDPTDPMTIIVRELEMMMAELGHSSSPAFQKLANKLLRDGKPA